jgi:hypothetical protein
MMRPPACDPMNEQPWTGATRRQLLDAIAPAGGRALGGLTP